SNNCTDISKDYFLKYELRRETYRKIRIIFSILGAFLFNEVPIIMSKKSIFINDGVNYTAPFMVISMLFLTWGIAHGLLDTLDKNFQELLHLKKWQSSFIQVSLYGAYFCTAI